MKRKNMARNALFTSIMSLLLCVSMLVGTTFAWFTDSVTSGNNVIAAGNLDIEVMYANAPNGAYTSIENVGDLFVVPSGGTKGLWEPGHTEVAYLKVVNNGTLALKYQFKVDAESEVIGESVLGNEIKLSEILKFAATNPSETAPAEYSRATAQAAAEASESKLLGYTTKTVTLEPEKEHYIALVVYMPESTGNEANYRGDKVPTINFRLTALATQVVNENDSFGPTYDENAWGDGFDIYTEQDLNAAIADGETNIDVMDDIELNGTIEIPASAATYDLRSTPNAVRINLNGYTITGTMHKDAGPVIKNEGNLILENGTVSSTGNNGGSALVNNGTAVLKNVTLNGAPNADGGWPSYTVNNTGGLTATKVLFTSYHGAVASYGEGALVTLNNCTIDMAGIPGFTSHGIYTYNNGAVVVNGGTYANKATDQNASGASVINGAVTINGGTFSGRIENYYGTPVIKGGTFSVNPNESFVADGFELVDNGNGTYTVGFPQASFDELIENAGENETIEVPAGEYTFPASDIKAGQTLICAPGTVFEGSSSLNINGATVIGATFDADEGNVAGTGTINGTFKDCTFTGSEALRWCYTTEGTTTVFEGCVIKTDFRGVHFDAMNGDVIFRNCEINGFNAIGGTGTVTFENCTFGHDNSKYNGLNMYVDTTLTNCEFAFVTGKTNFIDFEAPGKTLKITNCTATLDGDPADVVEFVGGTYKNETNIVKLMPSEDGIVLAENAITGVVSLYNTADYTGTTLNVPEGVKAIGNYAFAYNTNVETVVLASTVSDLGRGFDSSTTVKKVVLNEGLKTISSRAFKSTTALKEVVISSTVKEIADNAFQKSGIKEITIPATVETIGETAFGSSMIEKVVIEGNTSIQGYAFRGCANLREVYLNGDDVTFIPSTLNGRNSTWFCNSESNNPNVSDITFYVKNETVAARVKAAMGADTGKVEIYVNDDLYEG